MSLQSEIELRRARLAELRRQRDAQASSMPEDSRQEQSSPKQPRNLAVSTAVLFSLDKPVTYNKETQTDYEQISSELQALDTNTDNQPLNEKPQPIKAKEEPRFSLDMVDEPPESLLHFLDDAWRALARANAGAQPIKSYNQITSAQAPLKGSGGAIVEESRLGTVTTTNVAWSPMFTELAATCNRESNTCQVWSLDAPDMPEYTLSSATNIVCLAFSQRSANIVLGGGSNGQVLRWNLDAGGRIDLMPSLRSQLDGKGHTEAVIAIEAVPGAADDLFATLSSDGSVCTWLPDMLARPQTRAALVPPPHTALASVGVSGVPSTALSLHPHHLGGAFVGTLAGQIVWMSWNERLEDDDDARGRNRERGNVIASVEPVHEGPITALAMRPMRPGSADASDGCWMVSAALDWKLILWSVAIAPVDTTEPPMVKSLEIVTDVTVYDIAWYPGHPSIFAAACDAGIQVWDLSRSQAAPVHSLTTPTPLYKLQWARAGGSTMHILGSGPGGAHVFGVPAVDATDANWTAFSSTFRHEL